MKLDRDDKKDLIEKLELKDALVHKSIRDVFWRLIEKSEFYTRSNVKTVEEANYNNGRRDVVLGLIEEIEEASQTAWMQMQNDANESEE
tara:strand:+ start:368 stop:634 length:267 start_codon:yes stop_codon:yes gene_type:complete